MHFSGELSMFKTFRMDHLQTQNDILSPRSYSYLVDTSAHALTHLQAACRGPPYGLTVNSMLSDRLPIAPD